ILKTFGPHLVPGRSRVVLQDFRHYYTHFLPVVFDGNPDLWEETEAVAEGATVTFRPRREVLGPGGWSDGYDEARVSFESASRIYHARIARESPANQSLLKHGLFRKALIEGADQAAADLASELQHDWAH